MATPRNPNDPREPYRANDPYRPIDPTRPDLEDDGLLRTSRLETDLQPDPELAEGRASGGKIAIAAFVIAVLLGAVFYGLNNSSTHQGTSSTAQTSAPATPKAAPGGNPAGTTTGSAPSQTSPPPASPAPASK
jgi:hypothetical protein